MDWNKIISKLNLKTMGGILGQIATGLIGQGMGLISDSRNQRQNEQNAKREYKYGNMMAEETLS